MLLREIFLLEDEGDESNQISDYISAKNEGRVDDNNLAYEPRSIRGDRRISPYVGVTTPRSGGFLASLYKPTEHLPGRQLSGGQFYLGTYDDERDAAYVAQKAMNIVRKKGWEHFQQMNGAQTNHHWGPRNIPTVPEEARVAPPPDEAGVIPTPQEQREQKERESTRGMRKKDFQRKQKKPLESMIHDIGTTFNSLNNNQDPTPIARQYVQTLIDDYGFSKDEAIDKVNKIPYIRAVQKFNKFKERVKMRKSSPSQQRAPGTQKFRRARPAKLPSELGQKNDAKIRY